MTCHALEFKNVSYKYPSTDNLALTNVSLKVPKNSFFIVTGPTGCGKSTLLALARGFYEEYGGELQGSICVSGKNTRDLDITKLGTNIGIIFQDPACQLHQLRAIDEVMSGPMYQNLPWKECIERAEKALSKVTNENFFQRSPTELSSGEQQRVALAALLAMKCNILLLDEPFSYLDCKAVRDILDILLKLKREGKTIILATHNLEPISRYADKIALMSARGRVILEDTPRNVLYSNELKKTLIPPLSVRVARTLIKKRMLSEKTIDWQELVEKADLEIEESKRPGPNKHNNKEIILEVKNISCSYPSGDKGVENLSLRVHEGEILGLVGANGSGKTTLAKLILGLLKISKGSMKLSGEEITKLKTHEIAQKVGYVTQNPSEMLFESTVFRECSFGPLSLGIKNPDKKVRETLNNLGLLRYAHKHPALLSGGEKRLLSIGDILVNQPEILILDEPEFGLDPKTWNSIAHVIDTLKNEGKTVIVITHNLEITLFLCDRIALISEGRVLKVGEPMEIYGNSKLLERAGLISLPIFGILKLIEDYCENSLSEDKLTTTLECQKD